MLPKKLASKREIIELFNISFPRITVSEAIEFILENIQNKKGSLVCFPDMSMINLLESDSKLKLMISEKFVPFNDGIGLQLASKMEQLPFPENLNGTDFTPLLLNSLSTGTKVFLIGSKGDTSEKTKVKWEHQFPQVNFVGAHSGFFSQEAEETLVKKLQLLKPDIILVGMGNPQQLRFIEKHSKYKELSHSQWMAIGGLFDFYGGERTRAPQWMINARLEWLHIILTEPHKFFRYVLGIPMFIYSMIKKTLYKDHKSNKQINRFWSQ